MFCITTINYYIYNISGQVTFILGQIYLPEGQPWNTWECLMSSRVCVCVCVCVYVVYEDTNLYNDMGMTQVLQGEADLSTFSVSP